MYTVSMKRCLAMTDVRYTQKQKAPCEILSRGLQTLNKYVFLV